MFDLYISKDEKDINVGTLIPEVIVPSWAFMCQTMNEDNIYEFVRRAKDDLIAAKILHQRVKDLAQSLSR